MAYRLGRILNRVNAYPNPLSHSTTGNNSDLSGPNGLLASTKAPPATPLVTILHILYATPMPDPVDPKAFLNLCEMSIDSMYELAALGELLEQKGLLTKQEIITLATELKHQNSPADTVDIPNQPFTAQENTVIEELMAVILQHGLSADHAKTLLARIIQLLEWGKQVAHKIPEANA